MYKTAEYHRAMLIILRAWGYLKTAIISYIAGVIIAAWIIWPPGVFMGLVKYGAGHILSLLPIPDFTGAVAFYAARVDTVSATGLWFILYPPLYYGILAIPAALIIRFLIIGYLARRNGGRIETGQSITLR